jgi:UDP-glucose 4-epimerase
VAREREKAIVFFFVDGIFSRLAARASMHRTGYAPPPQSSSALMEIARSLGRGATWLAGGAWAAFLRLPTRARAVVAVALVVGLGLLFGGALGGGSGSGSGLSLLGAGGLLGASCPVPVLAESKGKKVLVTGATGFIGTHIATYCAETLGMEVVGVDDMSGGFDYNLHPSWTFVKGDLRDPAFVKKLFKEHGPFNYVYHIAAYAAEGLSHFIRRYNYQTNLLASINVLNEAVKGAPVTTHYIFTSSIAVYGTGRTPLSEDMVPQPEDPYGVSKFAMELDLKAAHEMFGINFVVFRPHNVYGPGQNIADRYRNVIGIFMRQIMEGQPMTIFGDGGQTRAFSYIDDVAPQIAMSPLIEGARNQVFNVGADQPYTLLQLAQAVRVAMGAPTHEIRHLPPRNEVLHAHSDHTKLRCVFGIKTPPVSLESGLKSMATWVLEQAKKQAFTPWVFSNIEIEKNMPQSWVRVCEGGGGGFYEQLALAPTCSHPPPC